MRTPSFLLAGLLAALPLASCGNGGYVEVGASSSALSPNVDVARPPSIIPIGAQLMVTITRVAVRIGDEAAEPAEPPATTGKPADPGQPANPGQPSDQVNLDETGWITIFSGSRRIDLTDASATEAFLGGMPVPAGRVSGVRLYISDVVLSTVDSAIAVKCPSCAESGFKVVVPDDVMVTSGGRLHLTLTFDLAQSLVSDGAGGFILKPVIVLQARAATD
jgi:hypothetical protein